MAAGSRGHLDRLAGADAGGRGGADSLRFVPLNIFKRETRIAFRHQTSDWNRDGASAICIAQRVRIVAPALAQLLQREVLGLAHVPRLN